MRKSPVNRKNPALVPGSGRGSHLPDGGEGREQAGCLNWRVTDREGFISTVYSYKRATVSVFEWISGLTTHTRTQYPVTFPFVLLFPCSVML